MNAQRVETLGESRLRDKFPDFWAQGGHLSHHDGQGPPESPVARVPIQESSG